MSLTEKNRIELIAIDYRVDYVKFEPEYSAICSIGKAPFYGKVTIEYKPKGEIIELEGLEDFIRSFSDQKVTIEKLSSLVFEVLRLALGDIPLRVTVHARTTVHAPALARISQGEF